MIVNIIEYFSIIINKIKKTLHILFPEYCINCNNKLLYCEYSICKECIAKIEQLKNIENKCSICSQPLKKNNNLEKRICNSCSRIQFKFKNNLSLIRYDEIVKKIILDSKNNGYNKLFEYFIKNIINLNDDYIKKYIYNIDLIIPVPIDKRTYLKRGFNQSEILARNISDKYKKEYSNKIIKLKYKKKAQKELNYEDRFKTFNKTFEIIQNKYVLKDKNILIVDDVFTTGATLNAISTLLKNEFKCNIKAFTLVRVVNEY